MKQNIPKILECAMATHSAKEIDKKTVNIYSIVVYPITEMRNRIRSDLGMSDPDLLLFRRIRILPVTTDL